MSCDGFFLVFSMKSRKKRSATMPSRSGRCIEKPKPPDSSPPIIAPVSCILGPMYLKPTGTSWTSTPYRSPSRSAIEVMFTVLTTGCRSPRIGVAVDREADVGPLRRNPGEELVDVRRDWLGIHAAEERVALAVQLDHLRAAATDELRKVPACAPVQRLAHDRV